MALTDLDVPAHFVGLDSGAVGSGKFLNSATLTTMAQNSNCLVRGKTQELLTLMTDVQGSGAGIYHAGYLTWNRLIPGVHVVPKMPGLNKADLYLFAKIPNGQTVWLQVETLRSPPNLSAGYSTDPRTMALVGDGTMKSYHLAGFPIDEGAYERFGFWIMGVGSSTLADLSLGPQSAKIASVDRRADSAVIKCVDSGGSAVSFVNDSSGSATVADYHYILAHTGGSGTTPGSTLYQASIVGVPASDTLRLIPPPSDDAFARFLVYHYFIVYQLPRIQVGSLAIFAQPRTT